MSAFVAFAGSTRTDSFNNQVANLLAGQVREQGGQADHVSLSDFDLPIYNGDLEQADGLPANAKALKQKFLEARGLIIVTPEYNGFMPPLLINAIDWCTRSDEASVDLSCFSGKPVFIAAASPGPGGGGRAANHLKTMLSGIGAYVSPLPLTVASAYEAFNESGQFADDKMAQRANKMMADFIDFSSKLS